MKSVDLKIQLVGEDATMFEDWFSVRLVLL
jgi:hypothetical protein